MAPDSTRVGRLSLWLFAILGIIIRILGIIAMWRGTLVNQCGPGDQASAKWLPFRFQIGATIAERSFPEVTKWGLGRLGPR